MSYVFLLPKNSIRGLKNVNSGRTSIFFEHFYSTNAFEFQGESLELFLSYLAHFTILDEFGSLLPARTVTVKTVQ